ncbi:putative short chain oxidoreductase/dehydrogenase [Hypoxylon sp. FL1150]|nr:putative short chain oxidoreductase/dehydrogenase [Hypoxylon sp. FL1150]
MTEATPQIWLITGASRGFGLAVARAALRAGHKVIACYRNKSRNPSTFTEIEALGGVWLQVDVVGENAESQVQSVIAQYGRIDVLVNNAGYPILGSIEHTGIDLIDNIFKTNFVGTIRTIQAALPSMRARRSGTIVNIGSSTAVNPTPGLGIYAATKAAVEGLTEALQKEVSPFNIRALVIHPGMMSTDILDPNGTGILLPLDDAYKGTPVELTYGGMFSSEFLSMAANPANVAQRIVEIVDGTGVMAGRNLGHLIHLGRDAGADAEARVERYAGAVKDTRDVWDSVYQ